MSNKRKIGKLGFIKIKNFRAAEDIKKVQKHPTKWEKIFAITRDKELVY